MLLENGLNKKNSHYMVGYDLGEEYSQISYCTSDQQQPETLPTVAGTELFNIPTVVCKRKETNQWFYGKEAVIRAETGEGYLVDHLVSRACAGELIELEGQRYDAVALLTIFVKRSFGLFFQLAPLNRIDMLVITAESMNHAMIKALEQVSDGLALQTKNVFFQSYAESVYEYMLHQPQELWQEETVVFYYGTDGIRVYHLEFNRHTEPVVGIIHSEKHDFVLSGPAEKDAEASMQKDELFARISQAELSEHLVSSVYLIGEGFTGEWMKLSLSMVCQAGQRVFQGSNLFSKGAACRAYEKQVPGSLSREYIFLGKSKLKSNIGMQVIRQGEDSYLALLDAGQNWYDAHTEYEVYLEEENFFSLLVTPLAPVTQVGTQDGKVREERIILDGLPDRPAGTTRLRLCLEMSDVEHLTLKVEDLGFGDIFPATHQIWSSTIAI